MEQLKISVNVSNTAGNLTHFEEPSGPSLQSLISSLKKIKSLTNDYLTQLVEDEKSASQNRGDSTKTNMNPETARWEDMEESDVELEDDYIDSEIKKELSQEQDVPDDSKLKRPRSSRRNKKKSKW